MKYRIKTEFEKFASRLLERISIPTLKSGCNPYHFSDGSSMWKTMSDAGVLDIWCEVVSITPEVGKRYKLDYNESFCNSTVGVVGLKKYEWILVGNMYLKNYGHRYIFYSNDGGNYCMFSSQDTSFIKEEL